MPPLLLQARVPAHEKQFTIFTPTAFSTLERPTKVLKRRPKFLRKRGKCGLSDSKRVEYMISRCSTYSLYSGFDAREATRFQYAV